MVLLAPFTMNAPMSFNKRIDSLWTFEMLTQCHTHKMKNVDSKKCHGDIKIKIKKKATIKLII
jgi:hypothetical protein